MIRAMKKIDIPAVIRIYRQGIKGRNATFETQTPSVREWDERHLKRLRFVYQEDEAVLGWIAFSPTSARHCYRGVIEVSVYIDPAAQGRGIGSALLQHAVGESEKMGFWTIFASIFPENEATLRLHLKAGFRIIGRREKIARLEGRWRDTLILERRSSAVGRT